jgi:hypothetical protein
VPNLKTILTMLSRNHETSKSLQNKKKNFLGPELKANSAKVLNQCAIVQPWPLSPLPYPCGSTAGIRNIMSYCVLLYTSVSRGVSLVIRTLGSACSLAPLFDLSPKQPRLSNQIRDLKRSTTSSLSLPHSISQLRPVLHLVSILNTTSRTICQYFWSATR